LFGNWLAIADSMFAFIVFRYSTILHLEWGNSLMLICKYFI